MLKRGKDDMSEERQQQAPEGEAEEHAESKTDEQLEREQEWSQGGQDVEEAQHADPDS